MKKICKILALVAGSLLIPSVLTGCGKQQNDPNTLNILCLDKGYGDAWMREAVSIWEGKNPDYKVKLVMDPNGDANGTVGDHIVSSKNTDDLYVSLGDAWRTFANDGRFLALDDLIEREVDGVKIKNKVADEYKDSLIYKTRNGQEHVYKLPWISGHGGIYYNAKYFGEGKWQIPTTTDELIALCETIKNSSVVVPGTDEGVVPFVYASNNAIDYFDYLVFSWWGQIAGKDAIEDFFKYEDAGVFDSASTTHPAYGALKQATQVWYDIFSTPGNALKQTNAGQAQNKFLNGYAAMMINCDWVYNEIETTLTQSGETWADYPNFELKLMKTPVVSGSDPANENTGYIVGENQFIAIPATSSKAELAKSFIEVLVSDAVIKKFNEKASGYMAYKLSPTGGTIEPQTECSKSVLAYRNGLDYAFTNYSKSRIYLSNAADIWTTSANRPYSELLATGNQHKSMDELFNRIKQTAVENWGEWLQQ